VSAGRRGGVATVTYFFGDDIYLMYGVTPNEVTFYLVWLIMLLLGLWMFLDAQGS